MERDEATISEEEFQRLCDEIYLDRAKVYGFNPSASRTEALEWMLLGCLISLLSVTDEELQALSEQSGTDGYGEIIRQLLRGRSKQPFDPSVYLDEMARQAENE